MFLFHWVWTFQGGRGLVKKDKFLTMIVIIITKKLASLELVSIIYTRYAVNIKSFLHSCSLWCIALPVLVHDVCRVEPKKLAPIEIKLKSIGYSPFEKNRSRIFAPLKASLQHAHLN